MLTGLIRICENYEKRNVNLTKSDFEPESKVYEADSVKVSGEFVDEFPQVKKQKEHTGKLTLIKSRTSISLWGNQIEITFDPSEIDLKESQFINYINRSIDLLSKNPSRINSEIARILLPIKNENWLDENEIAITETEFIKRIKLIAISFLEDGSSDLIFDDGDLFKSHQVIACFSGNNKIMDVDICG